MNREHDDWRPGTALGSQVGREDLQRRVDIAALVPEVLRDFEAALRVYFQNNSLRTSFQSGLSPWYADLEVYVLRRAKRIRPLLFLLGHGVFNPESNCHETPLMRAAVALELFHSFILIHDDIIDRSDRRRGGATLHRLLESRCPQAKDRGERTRLGMNTAMVMGDVLFALALETLLEAGFPADRTHEALGAFLRYIQDTGRGEILDIVFSSRELGRVSEAEIIKAYALKTTKYTFECPLTLGAILAGANRAALQTIAQFSRPIGLAFQIRNDLDEFQDEQASGKEIVEDLAEGKKTLLIRKAWNRLGRSDRVFLQTCFDARHLTDAAVKRIRELVVSSGAVAELHGEVNRLFSEAIETLNRSRLSGFERRQLLSIVTYLQQTMDGTHK